MAAHTQPGASKLKLLLPQAAVVRARACSAGVSRDDVQLYVFALSAIIFSLL